jgi:hypothetical protein
MESDVSQRFIRRLTRLGEEVVEGACRARFAVGQRTENCHVAFCPPLPTSPQGSCRQTEGPSARIKVAQVLPQGIRVELRLAEPAEDDASVVLEFSARSDPHQPRTKT